jgi:hypothetical protein
LSADWSSFDLSVTNGAASQPTPSGWTKRHPNMSSGTQEQSSAFDAAEDAVYTTGALAARNYWFAVASQIGNSWLSAVSLITGESTIALWLLCVQP